jgi:hypothetical protein
MLTRHFARARVSRSPDGWLVAHTEVRKRVLAGDAPSLEVRLREVAFAHRPSDAEIAALGEVEPEIHRVDEGR